MRMVMEQWIQESLLTCLEAEAGCRPEATALEYEGEVVSYGELNARANQVAHHLKTLGVGREVLVGLCFERSLELVVALLGVLKAGGAYVPLDPTYPPDRLAYMVADAQVPVLLTHRRVSRVLPSSTARVVCFDEAREVLESAPVEDPGTSIDPEQLAYVIYTSGSTGRPKGAMNSHGAILNRLLWMQSAYGLTTEDRVLQKTPFSFDVSVWEFLWPLMTGATLVIARPEGHRQNDYLIETITGRRITALHFVPSMLQGFLATSGAEMCRTLKQVMCSGEALPYELMRRFYEVLPQARLYNLYGPTEAAVDVTAHTCDPSQRGTSVPIGRPIANTRIYILDRHLSPTPIGVPGQLYIGGVQVGRGYHRRPELTAEKFIADPFSRQPGAQLYATGDLARFLPDGEIEYLGRIDHQIKLRGFRIELGEIEAVLLSHPGVQEAAILARAAPSGDTALVAYLVARSENLSSTALRAFLKQTLPDYMVPATFVLLDAMPLTPSGKLDRRALSELSHARPEMSQSYVEPRNEIEQGLASIWQELLHLERVGVEDNFFDLGGHSLLMVEVQSRLRKRFGRNIPTATLFDHPTIATLATFINAQAVEATGVDGDPHKRLSQGKDRLKAQMRRRSTVNSEGDGAP